MQSAECRIRYYKSGTKGRRREGSGRPATGGQHVGRVLCTHLASEQRRRQRSHARPPRRHRRAGPAKEARRAGRGTRKLPKRQMPAHALDSGFGIRRSRAGGLPIAPISIVPRIRCRNRKKTAPRFAFGRIVLYSVCSAGSAPALSWGFPGHEGVPLRGHAARGCDDGHAFTLRLRVVAKGRFLRVQRWRRRCCTGSQGYVLSRSRREPCLAETREICRGWGWASRG